MSHLMHNPDVQRLMREASAKLWKDLEALGFEPERLPLWAQFPADAENTPHLVGTQQYAEGTAQRIPGAECLRVLYAADVE